MRTANILAATALAATMSTAHAQTTERPPAIENIAQSAKSVTYIGEEAGLQVWHGVSKNGVRQMFYVAPDGRHLVAGLMYRAEGDEMINMTGVHVDRLTNGDLPIGETSAGGSGNDPKEGGTSDSRVDRASETPSRDIDSVSNVAAFERSVKGAAWFTVGLPEATPVYMVTDPTCSKCHEVWDTVERRVRSGKIQARIVLIGADESAKRKAMSLLAREDPGEAWINGEGIGAEPVRPLDEFDSETRGRGRRYLEYNSEFVSRYDLDNPPILIATGGKGVSVHRSGSDGLKAFLDDAAN